MILFYFIFLNISNAQTLTTVALWGEKNVSCCVFSLIFPMLPEWFKIKENHLKELLWNQCANVFMVQHFLYPDLFVLFGSHNSFKMNQLL